jgi:hypothetical protein
VWCYKRRWLLTVSLVLAGLAWLPFVGRDFWYPSVLALVGASLCTVGSIRLRRHSREALGVRLCVLSGLVASALAIVFGATSRSPLTAAAVALLPAVGFGLAALISPSLVHSKRHWSTYFAYGSILSAACVLGYGVWLTTAA